MGSKVKGRRDKDFHPNQRPTEKKIQEIDTKVNKYDSDEEEGMNINDEICSIIDFLYFNRGKKKQRKKYSFKIQELKRYFSQNFTLSIVEDKIDQMMEIFNFIFDKTQEFNIIVNGCSLFEVFIITVGGRKLFSNEKDNQITTMLLNKIKQGGIYSTDDSEVNNFEKGFQPSVSNKPTNLLTLSLPKKHNILRSPSSPSKIKYTNFSKNKEEEEEEEEEEYDEDYDGEDYDEEKEEEEEEDDEDVEDGKNDIFSISQYVYTENTQKRISILNSLILWNFMETPTAELVRKDGVIDRIIKEFWNIKKENPMFLSFCVSGVSLLLSKCSPSQIVNFFYGSKFRKKSFEQNIVNFIKNEICLELKLSACECIIICLDAYIKFHDLLIDEDEISTNPNETINKKDYLLGENKEQYEYIKKFSNIIEEEFNSSNQKSYSKQQSLVLKTSLRDYVDYLSDFYEPDKKIKIQKKIIQIQGWPSIVGFFHMKRRIGEGMIEHLENNKLVSQYIVSNEDNTNNFKEILNANKLEKQYYHKALFSKNSRSNKEISLDRKGKRRDKIMRDFI